MDVEEIVVDGFTVSIGDTVVFRKVELVEFDRRTEFWAFGRFCMLGPIGNNGLKGEKGSPEPLTSFGTDKTGRGGGLWYKNEFERPHNFVSSTQHESGTGFVNFILDGKISSTRPYF